VPTTQPFSLTSNNAEPTTQPVTQTIKSLPSFTITEIGTDEVNPDAEPAEEK
jgi:hypothetical protein